MRKRHLQAKKPALAAVPAAAPALEAPSAAAAPPAPAGTPPIVVTLQEALNNMEIVVSQHSANRQAHRILDQSIVMLRNTINNQHAALEQVALRLRALLDLPESNRDNVDVLLKALEDELAAEEEAATDVPASG